MSARLPEVASPCIQVCQMDPGTGLCRGCLRSLQEIADWLEMTPQEKRATLDRIERRRSGRRPPSRAEEERA
jgi:predicted Fe-S protein YdhL (DUF1289 family)